MKTQWCGLLASALLLGLIACSDTAKKETKQPEKPPEPVTGRQAFQYMYPAARTWILDAQPLQLQSYNLPQVKSANGRAGAWQATIVSVAQGQSRLYTYSVIEAEGNLHRGVFAGPVQSWSQHGQSTPFLVAAIKIDSDEAIQTAMKQKDTITFTTKYPDKPVGFLLEQTRRFPDLAWRVFWGESVGSSEYSVFIDATTGKFLEKVR